MKTKLALLFTAALFLPGCAGQQIGLSIPIPFAGPDIGKYGYLRLTPSYEPNALTTPYLNNLSKWTNYVSTNQYK